MDLDELKLFLKVDGNDLDVILTGYKEDAESFLLNAGATQDYTNSRYKVAVSVYCGILLRYPAMMDDRGNPIDPAVILKGTIAQLRLSPVTV